MVSPLIFFRILLSSSTLSELCALQAALLKMSNNDLWMRDVLASYGVIAVLVLCVVIWIIRKWPTLRKDIYKAHLLGFEVECAELAGPYKEHLFKALQCIASNDEMLRSMDSIRILEIGVKTGLNRTCTVSSCNIVDSR